MSPLHVASSLEMVGVSQLLKIICILHFSKFHLWFTADCFAFESVRSKLQVCHQHSALYVASFASASSITLVTGWRRDDQGCTPLHIAAARNRGALVDQLLKFGAGCSRFCHFILRHPSRCPLFFARSPFLRISLTFTPRSQPQ